MRHYIYDAYFHKDAETDEQIEFYVSRGDNPKIIGYQKSVSVQDIPNTTTKSQAELIDLARSALGEFTDVEYYSEVKISNGPYGTYDVDFYNKVGDIEVEDSSFVRVDKDGNVLEVKALPEPNILNAARFSDLNFEDFDAALEAQLQKAYTDYSCNNDEISVNVQYSGMTVENRKLSVDDNGAPVILYFVRPQLTYEYTYHGEAADIVEKKGIDINKSGISEPPVYAAISVK